MSNAKAIVFLVLQGFIFTQVGFTPFDGAFGGIFYTLAGFHGLRIVIGIGLMLLAFVRSLRGELTQTNHFAVTVATAYWHFPDVVWIVLFSLIYLVQRDFPVGPVIYLGLVSIPLGGALLIAHWVRSGRDSWC